MTYRRHSVSAPAGSSPVLTLAPAPMKLEQLPSLSNRSFPGHRRPSQGYAMAMQLLIIAGPEKGQIFPLTAGDIVLVGRSRATATKLTDPHVSRVHCQV